MKSNIKFSFILPIFNEELFISKTIDSLLAQQTSYAFEIIIADGMSNDRTKKIIEEKLLFFKNIIYIENKSKIVSTGFNLGLSISKGEYIIRVDGHSCLDNYFVENSIQIFKRIDADCVGGATEHRSNTFIGNIIRIAQISDFGTGGVPFRKKINKGMYVETLAFGVYKREVFSKIGGYDEELIRNQDDEFNFRLIQDGGRIWLDPKIKSIYYTRNSLLKFIKQYFQYGFYKPLVMRKRNGMSSIRHIIPGIFVLVFFALFFLMAFNQNKILFLLLLLSYSLTSVFHIIKILKNESINPLSSLLLFVTYFLMHFSYGIGTILGALFFKTLQGSKRVVDTKFNKKLFNKI